MQPIVCEICYEFLNNPSEYLAHQKAEHEEEEEGACGACGEWNNGKHNCSEEVANV